MKRVLTVLTVLAAMLMTTATRVLAAAGDKGIDVKVDVDRGGSGGGGWSVSPVWIAIGVIGGLLLIVLVVMAARGRDRTA